MRTGSDTFNEEAYAMIRRIPEGKVTFSPPPYGPSPSLGSHFSVCGMITDRAMGDRSRVMDRLPS